MPIIYSLSSNKGRSTFQPRVFIVSADVIYIVKYESGSRNWMLRRGLQDSKWD